MPVDTQTLIIGGSAAGLATAACLSRVGHPCEILEATTNVGDTWRRHYDRLHLHTPKSSSALPGLNMPVEWSRYPARDQVVDYLESYRDHHRLQPRYGQRVSRLELRDGAWVATTADRQWRAATVVVATGLAGRPTRPRWPGIQDYRGRVLHSSQYRNGEPWRGKAVLVIGFGNSAGEQAVDLVEHGAHPHLSVRSAVNVIPRDILGMPVLQLGIAMRHLPPQVADALARPMLAIAVGDVRTAGLRRLPYGPNTQIARDRRIPLIDVDTMTHIRSGDIRVHGGISRFTPAGVVFADGTSLEVEAVVLATGYRPALEDFMIGWRVVCDNAGIPRTSGRPTALPGLYFCGLHVSPAGMLREIGIEARRIAKDLTSAAQPGR